ncbi:MAG: hypothetical protein LBQ15_01990 [Clostridium sp.]|jgi:hypothetical protein|nr:hypothetical protein [Clostridium sp.]
MAAERAYTCTVQYTDGCGQRLTEALVEAYYSIRSGRYGWPVPSAEGRPAGDAGPPLPGEAQARKQDVFRYKGHSAVARDYAAFVEEYLEGGRA